MLADTFIAAERCYFVNYGQKEEKEKKKRKKNKLLNREVLQLQAQVYLWFMTYFFIVVLI